MSGNETCRHGNIAGTMSRRKALALLGMAGAGLLVAACSIGQSAQPHAPAPQNGSGNAPPAFGRGARMLETPAPELPETQPDVSGFLVRRQGASLFVGAGQGMPGQAGGAPAAGSGTRTPPNGTHTVPDGTPPAYTGVQVKVTIGSATKLYKDVTQVSNAANGTATPVQQELQTVNTLDSLITADTTGGTVTAWGSKNGEKVDATLVVYRSFEVRPVNAAP